MTTLTELEQLAKEVKGWSNCNQAWLDHSEDEPAAVVGHISEDGDTYPVATIDCDQYYEAQDSLKLARFYAAANPETVLRLIAMGGTPSRQRRLLTKGRNDEQSVLRRQEGRLFRWDVVRLPIQRTRTRPMAFRV